MLVARLALAGALATSALALSGCGQPEAANDNPGARTYPAVEPTIVRTPVKVSEAPVTVPYPGPTGGGAHGPAEPGSEG